MAATHASLDCPSTHNLRSAQLARRYLPVTHSSCRGAVTVASTMPTSKAFKVERLSEARQQAKLPLRTATAAARQSVVPAAAAVVLQAPTQSAPAAAATVRAPATGPRMRPNFDLPHALATSAMELPPSILAQLIPVFKPAAPEDLAMLPGIATERGPTQREMQDRHAVVPNITKAAARQLGSATPHPDADLWREDVTSMYVGVYDGHNGRNSSSRAAARMDELISRDRALWDILGPGLAELSYGSAAAGQEVVRAVQGALTRIFATLDAGLLEEDRMKPPGMLDGTAAVVGLQVGSHLFVARLGDSHAVVSRAGVAVRCGHDSHTPGDYDEQLRVKAAGGLAGKLRGSGAWRLVLERQFFGPKLCSVTRALGDLDWKEPKPIISCVPEVSHMQLQPGADKCVVYASGGVWVVLNEQQAVDCVDAAMTAAQLAGLPLHEAARTAASALLTHARLAGCKDDITVVVTPLEAAAISRLHFSLPWLN